MKMKVQLIVEFPSNYDPSYVEGYIFRAITNYKPTAWPGMPGGEDWDLQPNFSVNSIRSIHQDTPTQVLLQRLRNIFGPMGFADEDLLDLLSEAQKISARKYERDEAMALLMDSTSPLDQDGAPF